MFSNDISDAILVTECAVAAWEALMGLRMEAGQVCYYKQVFFFTSLNKFSIMVNLNTGCILFDVPK
jgi:hypothetical protein